MTFGLVMAVLPSWQVRCANIYSNLIVIANVPGTLHSKRWQNKIYDKNKRYRNGIDGVIETCSSIRVVELVQLCDCVTWWYRGVDRGPGTTATGGGGSATDGRLQPDAAAV